MAASKSEAIIRELLASADLPVNGSRAWDLQVRDERFYKRVLAQPYLGLGEGCMNVWWECEAIDEFITRVLRGWVLPRAPRVEVRRGNALLIGNAAGLATRDLCEGIGAAIRSGMLAAEVIDSDDHASYSLSSVRRLVAVVVDRAGVSRLVTRFGLF